MISILGKKLEKYAIDGTQESWQKNLTPDVSALGQVSRWGRRWKGLCMALSWQQFSLVTIVRI
jgi:hypothetical protein